MSEEVNRKCRHRNKRYNFQVSTPTPTLSAKIHSVTDRWTDGQTAVADHAVQQYDRLETKSADEKCLGKIYNVPGASSSSRDKDRLFTASSFLGLLNGDVTTHAHVVSRSLSTNCHQTVAAAGDGGR